MSIARPLRIEYPGAYYHVMNRGLPRRNIFLEDKDRERLLELLSETSGGSRDFRSVLLGTLPYFA
jgi:hypothetical protein